MAPDTQLLTPAEVAEHLRLKPGTVLRYIRRGELPAVNVATGRRKLPLYRVRSDDLAEWIAARDPKAPRP